MPNSPPESRAAYFEDFNEVDQVALPESRQTASTASTIDAAAQSSKFDASKPKPVRDEFSDSGYSSHTIATLGSGDSSSQASKLEAPPSNPETTSADSNSTLKSTDEKPTARSHSPAKQTLQRTTSKSKGRRDSRTKHCDCATCHARYAHRATAPAPNVNVPDSPDEKRAKSKRSSPLLPQLQRDRRPYPPQDAPILESAPPRPRTSNSQFHQRPRPMSFHAGMPPEGYFAPQPVMIEQRPPPRYTTPSPFVPPSYPPEPPFFPVLQVAPQPREFYAPVQPPFGLQPLPRQWPAEHPRRARPQSMYQYHNFSAPLPEYGPPIYEVAEPATRPGRRRSTRQKPAAPLAIRGRGDEAEDSRRMPPPPIPRAESRPRQDQRPIIRHAVTTAAAYGAPHQNYVTGERDDGHYARQTSRQPSFEDGSRSRRPSSHRPPRSSDEKVAQALQLEREMARMKIDRDAPSSSRSRRQSSVHGQDSLNELQGSLDAAEAYQASRGGTRETSTATPTNDDFLRLLRKKTHTSSDSGSRRSGKSKASREGGNDVRSIRRPSDESKAQDNDTQGLEMRIPKGVNVKLQPGIEGRTVSVRSSREAEGEMELRIGERGRVVGSRPTIRGKSGKRYSVVDGQAVTESDSSYNVAILSEEAPEQFDVQPRIIRERITTTSRSRHNSRSAYAPRLEGGFF